MAIDSTDTSFAEKYAKKSQNNISNLIQKKEKNIMTTTLLSNAVPSKNKDSNVSKDKSSKSDLIYLVKGVDEGRNAWYYVLVERLKVSLFLKALKDPIIHLENYGEVIHSAYGDNPPQEITDKLKKEYDIK
jgi:hypothetical protein